LAGKGHGFCAGSPGTASGPKLQNDVIPVRDMLGLRVTEGFQEDAGQGRVEPATIKVGDARFRIKDTLRPARTAGRASVGDQELRISADWFHKRR
jgi:hypothetical protein